MQDEAYEGGRAVWLRILLQDNDHIMLTLPWLLFPPTVSCGIFFIKGGGQQMG